MKTIIFSLFLLLCSSNLRAYGVQMELDYSASQRKVTENGMVQTSRGPDSLNLAFFPLVAADDMNLVGGRIQFGMRNGISFAFVPAAKISFPIMDNLTFSPGLTLPYYIRPETMLGVGALIQSSYNFLNEASLYLSLELQSFFLGAGIPKNKDGREDALFEYRFAIGFSKRAF